MISLGIMPLPAPRNRLNSGRYPAAVGEVICFFLMEESQDNREPTCNRIQLDRIIIHLAFDRRRNNGRQYSSFHSGGKMRIKFMTVAVLIFLFTIGCTHYGALEEDFGKSYQAAIDSQTLNPGASKNLGPVSGLPGAAAEGTMKKYTESFSPSGQASQTPQSFAITPIVPTEGAGTGKNVYGK